MNTRWTKYVRHEEVTSHEAKGWRSTNGLNGSHHGEWSVLMEWHGEGEPNDKFEPIHNPHIAAAIARAQDGIVASERQIKHLRELDVALALVNNKREPQKGTA